MNVRMFPCLLALIISDMSGVLYASCGGCSRGQNIVAEATATAASTGLSGLLGAAGTLQHPQPKPDSAQAIH